MKIAQVFVEHPIMHLDHTFTYACDGFSVQRGVRVQVPFGKTSIIGFVMQVETITEQQAAGYGFTIRPIDKVIDEEPLLNEELFALGEWMAKTCIVPMISCFWVPPCVKCSTAWSSAKVNSAVSIACSPAAPLRLPMPSFQRRRRPLVTANILPFMALRNGLNGANTGAAIAK